MNLKVFKHIVLMCAIGDYLAFKVTDELNIVVIWVLALGIFTDWVEISKQYLEYEVEGREEYDIEDFFF